MPNPSPDDEPPQAPDSDDARPWPARMAAWATRDRLRLAAKLVLLGGGTLLLAAAVYTVVLLRAAPDAADLREAGNARASVLLAADGSTLATFSRDQQRHVTLAQGSPYVLRALIATEDRRFYEHHGIDVRRTAGALFRTATGDLQGGSTLTQQLARNLFP